jgi:molybdopterin-binding protein
MNRLPGTVTAIQSAGHVALADVEVSGGIMSALLIEGDAQATHLNSGAPVLVLFQETEVSLAKDWRGSSACATVSCHASNSWTKAWY